MQDIRPQTMHTDKHDRGSRSWVGGLTEPSLASKVLVLLLVVASVLVITVMALGLWSQVGKAELVKKDQYQAVFLTNGQVYFGKLDSIESKYLSMSDVYYLQQTQQQVQPGQEGEAQLSLIKLGNELHGPEAQMYITRDQVLFWENLKDDGKVVQAIKGKTQ